MLNISTAGVPKDSPTYFFSLFLGLQILLDYVQDRANYNCRGRAINVSNFDVIVAKQLLEGFGFYASWYINTWAIKWNSSFLQTIGGPKRAQTYVYDFFNTAPVVMLVPQKMTVQVKRATPEQIQAAMERIWEIGVQNKKWDQSVLQRSSMMYHRFIKIEPVSTYVLKQWVKMQIGDMFRLVGDLSTAETHIMRVVTALVVGSSNRVSNKEESSRILQLANQAQLLLAQIVRRQAQLANDLEAKREREASLRELYINLEQRAQTREVQLFASYQRVKFELENSPTPTLIPIQQVERSYENEIASMGKLFVPGCEMDIQHQHVSVVKQWCSCCFGGCSGGCSGR